MKKGTKSRNAGGRLHPLEDPEKVIKYPKRHKPKSFKSVKELFNKYK